jgi:translation initiation factor IF-3
MNKKRGDGFRVNREIYAQEVRVIDDSGAMLGVMSVPQAIRMAEDRGLDLIEIAPTANPPTCKIMDYGKYKYEKKKAAGQARKNQVIVDIKEVQIRPRTDDHDLQTKIRHARRFLLEGDKVKVSLRFSGREMAYQDEGMVVLNKFTEAVNDLAIVESAPKKEGRQVFVLYAPDAAKIKDFKKREAAGVAASTPPKTEAPA